MHAGYGTIDGELSSTSTAGVVDDAFESGAYLSEIDVDADGVLGGAQAGVNYQIGRIVLGLEADLSGTDIDGDFSRRTTVTDPQVDNEASQELDVFGTVRGRIGFVPFERLLAYATGGFAYGHGEVEIAFLPTDCPGNFLCPVGSESDWLTGWTVGGGFELAAGNNWTFKGEYLYYDLGDIDLISSDPRFPIDPTNNIVTTSAEFKGHIFRVGLNYLFGGHDAALQ